MSVPKRELEGEHPVHIKNKKTAKSNEDQSPIVDFFIFIINSKDDFVVFEI
jgi:hypothetical protein